MFFYHFFKKQYKLLYIFCLPLLLTFLSACTQKIIVIDDPVISHKLKKTKNNRPEILGLEYGMEYIWDIQFCYSQKKSSSKIVKKRHRPIIQNLVKKSENSKKIIDCVSVTKRVKKCIYNKAMQWKGVPYRMGGTTRKGIDCSAFVRMIYQSVFGFQLPRETKDQVKQGYAVSRKHLKPGDLVFFKPPTYVRHVGIYIDNNKFAHASSKYGVTIADLNNPYFRRSYWTSRRIIPSLTILSER